MAVIHFNEQGLDTALSAPGVVLVDFWAGWCGPCRMLSPIVEELAEENPHIKVAKVDVDDQQELALQFSVMTIPSLFVFKNGKQVAHAVGVKSKEELLELVG